MGLSVWRETSKKLTVCREKGKKLTVCRELFFVQITVLFVEGLNGVKRVAWNIQKINRVPCLLHPHWDPHNSQGDPAQLRGQNWNEILKQKRISN